MRVIHTRTGQFVNVPDFRKVRYAILSHTWDPGGKQTYQELCRIQESYGPDGHPWPRVESSAPIAHVDVPPASCPVNAASLRSHTSMVPTEAALVPDDRQSSEPSILEEPARTASLAEPRPVMSPPDNSPSEAPAIWRDSRLSEKVRRACEAARADGYDYVWIDSCCIIQDDQKDWQEQAKCSRFSQHLIS